MCKRITLAMLSFLLCICCIAGNAEFLPVDEAFQLKEQINTPTELHLDWTIAPQYHLYSDSIAVKVLAPTGAVIAPIHLPQGKLSVDSSRPKNAMEYYSALTIPVRMIHGSTAGLILAVTNQR